MFTVLMERLYQHLKLKSTCFPGYRFLEDPSFTSSQRLIFDTDPEIRQKMNVADDQQVSKILLDRIDAIQRDVQVP